MKNFKNSIKEYLKGLSKKMIITIILTLSIAGYLAVKAAFVEPGAAPASSDQDFAENVMGANNADNDYSSSNVVANRDGSILERLEYIFTGSTCGNSVVEVGENCDDGGTSWTSGACAGDCSRRNYWSSPSYASDAIGAGTLSVSENANAYCQERGFRVYTSLNTTTGSGLANYRFLFNTSSSLDSTFAIASSTSYSWYSSFISSSTSFTYTIYSWLHGWNPFFSSIVTSAASSSSMNPGGTNTYRYYFSSITSIYLTQFSSNNIISEIWCAD